MKKRLRAIKNCLHYWVFNLCPYVSQPQCFLFLFHPCTSHANPLSSIYLTFLILFRYVKTCIKCQYLFFNFLFIEFKYYFLRDQLYIKFLFQILRCSNFCLRTHQYHHQNIYRYKLFYHLCMNK